MAELGGIAGGAVGAVVGSGEAASEALAAPATDRPDLVLLDVNLPGIDGIETAARIDRLARPVRGVLTSTTAASDLPADVFDGGVSGFVPKSELSPDSVGELLAG